MTIGMPFLCVPCCERVVGLLSGGACREVHVVKISACREIHRLHDDGRCDSWAAKVKVDGGRVRASCESRRPKRSALPTIDRAPSRTNSSTCRHPSGRRIINFRDCKLNCFLPLVRTVQRAARPKTSSTRVETRRYRQCVSVTAVISSPPPPLHMPTTPTRPHAHTLTRPPHPPPVHHHHHLYKTFLLNHSRLLLHTHLPHPSTTAFSTSAPPLRCLPAFALASHHASPPQLPHGPPQSAQQQRAELHASRAVPTARNGDRKSVV